MLVSPLHSTPRSRRGALPTITTPKSTTLFGADLKVVDTHSVHGAIALQNRSERIGATTLDQNRNSRPLECVVISPQRTSTPYLRLPVQVGREPFFAY